MTGGTGSIVFDGTINLGNIITMVFGAIVWAITLTLAWTKLGGRISMLEFKADLVDKALEKIAEILTKFTTNEKEVALLRQQVNSLELQHAALFTIVEGLRRGEGYIHERRRGVDGEYP